jgi:FkbM family methyltransferase
MYYSQCGEDWFLNTNYFHDMSGGIYIELGALDGLLYSNTKFFEDKLGWTGFLIEPHPLKFQKLQENRPNNFLFNELVSCETKELTFRYFKDLNAAVSGVDTTLSQHHMDNYYCHPNSIYYDQGNVTMKPKTLTEIIKSKSGDSIDKIDLLSLDVEGHEYEVLCSWDFSIPIKVILIEMLGADKERDEMCRKILIERGYRMDNVYKHNEIYILK